MKTLLALPALLLVGCAAQAPTVGCWMLPPPPVQEVQRSENAAPSEPVLTQSLHPQVQHGTILSPAQKLEMERQANQLKVQ
jgi:hypothetical protein